MKPKRLYTSLCLISTLCLFAGRLSAARLQQAPAGLDSLVHAGSAMPPDTLKLHDHVIAVFRGSLLGYPPEQRRLNALERIMRVLESGRVDSVHTKPIPQGLMIAMGNQGVFVLTPADIDSSSGETLQSVSARVAENLRQAVQFEIQQRSFTYRLKAAALTILATALFVFLLWALRRGHRFVDERLQRAARKGISKARLEELALIDANRPLAYLRRLIGLAAWMAVLLLTYIWLTFSLRRFPYTRPWGDSLRGFFLTTFENFGFAILRAIPDVITVVLVFIITRFVVRALKAFFNSVEAGKVTVPWLHADIVQPTRRIAVIILWVFAFIVAFPYLPGSESEAFKGVSVFLGLVLSLGSSGVVSQMMSGFVIMYSRAFKVGDYIRIGDLEGSVTALGIFSTKIKTIKREEVTVPNNVITSTTVKNFSRLHATEGVLLYASVTIGYGTPWRQVHALLIMAAERTPGLRREPPPFVGQVALSDFYVEYQVNAYLEKPEARLPTLALLHANIQDAFNEYGVQILSPHYEADPPQPVWVPKEKWYEAPAQRNNDAGAKNSHPQTKG